MDHTLDHHLDQADRYAAEDGQAERRAYCWTCQQYVPWDAMPPLPHMMCAWCEDRIRDFDVDAFMEDIETRIERLEHSKRHADRVNGVSDAVQRTFDAIFEEG